MVEISPKHHLCGSRPTVLVAGETVCNVHTWGTVLDATGAASALGTVAPATLPVFRSAARQVSLGGAASIAANLRALGCDVRLLSVLGADAMGRQVRELLRQGGIADTFVLEDVTRPTTTRTYLIAADRHLLRLDHESRAPLSPPLASRLLGYLNLLMAGTDGIVCSDQGNGLCVSGLLGQLFADSQRAGCPIFVGFEGQDPALYRGATALVARFGQPEQLFHTTPSILPGLEEAARCLLGPSQAQALLLDRSPDGLSLFCPPDAPLHIPTGLDNRLDGNGYSASDGSGQTVIAAFSAGVLNGLPMTEAARLAAASALL